MDPDQPAHPRGCAGWSGSMLVANQLCWFCHDAAQILKCYRIIVDAFRHFKLANIFFHHLEILLITPQKNSSLIDHLKIKDIQTENVTKYRMAHIIHSSYEWGFLTTSLVLA
jgi:hypothetical protein